MRRILLATMLSSAAASVHAVDSRQQADAGAEACYQEPHSRCWQAAADFLEKHPGDTAEERGVQYLSLSVLARKAGDFADASRFLARAEEELMPAAVAAAAPDADAAGFMGRVFKLVAAQIQLSEHDYAGALASLQLVGEKALGDAEFVQLSKAAALVGLGRDSEAEPILRGLQGKLRLDGARGYCATGMLPGIEELNPYDVGRRIAAFYARLGKKRDALSLLETLEAARVLNLRDGAYPSQPWANLIEPASLQQDRAIVLGTVSTEALVDTRRPLAESLDQFAATLPLLH